jgi:hypothetical protein
MASMTILTSRGDDLTLRWCKFNKLIGHDNDDDYDIGDGIDNGVDVARRRVHVALTQD